MRCHHGQPPRRRTAILGTLREVIRRRTELAEPNIGLAARLACRRMSGVRPADKPVEELAAPAPPKPSQWWIDVTLIAMLLPLAVVARRPEYLFSHAFWLDEGWVHPSGSVPCRSPLGC